MNGPDLIPFPEHGDEPAPARTEGSRRRRAWIIACALVAALAVAAVALVHAVDRPEPAPSVVRGSSAPSTATGSVTLRVLPGLPPTPSTADPGVPAASSTGLSDTDRQVAALVDADPGLRDALGGGDRAARAVRQLCGLFDRDPGKAASDVHAAVHRMGWSDHPGRNAAYVELLEQALPIACPEHGDAVDDARHDRVPLVVDDGTWLVPQPHSSPFELRVSIVPGTYRLAGPAVDCYWERTAPDGTMREQRFAHDEPEASVTVLATDAVFISRGCGRWVRAR
ncbi:hypothetical protein [Saccharothrix sp. HUAS TT1]|uniref:hypothetical protein n=1 Tax=unclassified Saccharothrix TaxID=2593673 RepID=UPI00345BA533